MKRTLALIAVLFGIVAATLFAQWQPATRSCCSSDECAVQQHHRGIPDPENFTW